MEKKEKKKIEKREIGIEIERKEIVEEKEKRNVEIAIEKEIVVEKIRYSSSIIISL